eukprot:1184487-Prorocentrum_minimum.AAC.1
MQYTALVETFANATVPNLCGSPIDLPDGTRNFCETKLAELVCHTNMTKSGSMSNVADPAMGMAADQGARPQLLNN